MFPDLTVPGFLLGEDDLIRMGAQAINVAENLDDPQAAQEWLRPYLVNIQKLLDAHGCTYKLLAGKIVVKKDGF